MTEPSSSHSTKVESSDASSTGILAVGILALMMGLVIFLVCDWLFHSFEFQNKRSTRPLSVFTEEHFNPPGPKLEINPQLNLSKMLNDTQKTLNSFAWIDQKEKWVRIPIEDAMNLLIQEETKRSSKTNQTRSKYSTESASP